MYLKNTRMYKQIKYTNVFKKTRLKRYSKRTSKYKNIRNENYHQDDHKAKLPGHFVLDL